MIQHVEKGPKVALCRACHGTGVVQEAAECLARFFGRKKAESVEKPCPQCGGSGRVTVSARMELDIRPYKTKETLKE